MRHNVVVSLVPPDVVIAPRYLARFRCIAEACEDTCCGGWKVAIDDATVARWDAHLDAARVEALVDRGARRLRVVEDPAMMSGHACAALAPDRRCQVQRELGEAALPDTCALFPRVLQRAGDRFEATASLACPEIARLSLLVADGHELTELPVTPLMARAPHTQIGHGDAALPWIAAGPALRDAIDRALADPAWPIATRLYALADAAERSRSYFHRQATDRDARRLPAELTAALAPAAMAPLHDELFGDEPAAFAGPAIVAELIAARLTSPTVPPLRAAMEAALAETDTGAHGSRALSPARLWTAHEDRMSALPDAVTVRLDAIDAAWARHTWRQRWHLFAPDLFAHALLHLVGRAFVRTLIAAHPRVAADPDAVALEIIRLYTRHFEHAGLHDQLGPQLRAKGLATRAVARALLLF